MLALNWGPMKTGYDELPWWGLTAPGWWVQPDRCLIDEQFALGSSGRRRSHDGGWLKDKPPNQMVWLGGQSLRLPLLSNGFRCTKVTLHCNIVLQYWRTTVTVHHKRRAP
jgi:hypothetical protein